jgi:diguanylate cyclase (GGDEF)-like protein/PAS domain S-box-containing protein
VAAEARGQGVRVPADQPIVVNAEEILDALPERVVRYRLSDLRIVYCNASWATGHRIEPEEAIGRSLRDFLTEDGALGLERQLARLGPDDPLLADEVPREDLTSPGRWIEWVDRYLPSGEIIAVGRDVTDRHRMELELLDREARFRELADHSSDIVFRFLLEPTPHFDYVSPSATAITGHSVSTFLADFYTFLELLDDDSRALVLKIMSGEITPERADITGRAADGSTIVMEAHFSRIAGGLQGVAIDVTELRGLQRDLADRALHDALTGLANRHLVDELLAVGLARAERSGTILAVAFVDFDEFKAINDTYGHQAGDVVLREAARRMLSVSRSADIVARLGGDEFLIVFEPNVAGARHLLERVEAVLTEPIEIRPGVSIRCRPSIGYADSRSSGRNALELLAAADEEMYAVKRAHRRLDAAEPS